MILADTSIAVAVWRAPTPRLLKIIQDYDAAVSGVTVAEIFAGARSPAEFPRCSALLGIFGQMSISEPTWEALGRNINSMRLRGITVPFPDALIATIALQNNVELWTYDAHFPLIQGILPQLRLFVEPP